MPTRTPTKAPAKVPTKSAATKKAPTKAPAKKAPAKAAAQKVPAAKKAAATAKKAMAGKKAPTRAPAKAPAKTATKKTPAKKTPAKKAPAKKVAPAKKSAATTKNPLATTKKPSVPARKSAPASRPAATRRVARTVTPAPSVHAPLPRALRDLYATHHQALAPIWDPATGLTVNIKVPASIALHPTRKRCKACNHALGNEAVLRMFCTYACAGLPSPDFNTTTAPRQCKRAARSDEAGEWAFKQRFTTEQAAAHYLRPGTTLYRCSNCFFLHIGNVSAPPQVGIPSAPTSGRGPFEDAVLAVLHTRRLTAPTPVEVANVKRDVRAVFDALRKHQTAGGTLRLPNP